MAFSVAQVTARVRQACPSFYPDDATDENGTLLALMAVNEANVRIAMECGIYRYVSEDISLVAGQQEYSKDPTDYQVANGTYYTSSSSWFPLRQTSIDELDEKNRAWRDDGPGSPFEYYLNGDLVGFYQKPDQTTVAGYPKVVLSVRRANSFADYASTLPPQAPTMDAWVYAVCLQWALDHGDERIQFFDGKAEASLSTLKSFMLRMLQRQNPAVKPRYSTPRNR